VIARTSAVIEAGGVLGEVSCTPPLTLRQVHGDTAGRCELRLVGTAAGPLAGDDLSISLRLRAGARATLAATGASLAQGRDHAGTEDGRDRHGTGGHGTGGHGTGGHGTGGAAATLAIRADLADGADLVADPGTLVVCRGSRVDVHVELTLGAGATVQWRELIVLGRTGEPAGRATLRWDVTRLGRPVLRQFVDLADPMLTAWGGLTARRRVLACALICDSDPARAARTVVASAMAVAQRVDDHTVLVTVLDDDATGATRTLEELCVRAQG